MAVAPPIPPVEENIREEEFEVLFPRNFAEYMAATLVDRAIPDARDGMKPVQRRILYSMLVSGYRSSRSTVKSAKIVGEVTGLYHPHGDAAIYQTMARMAQDFTLRYPLVIGQGCFGCFTGDTRVKLQDGTEKSFEELARLPEDEVFYVYSTDRAGRIVVGKGRRSRVTRRQAQLVALVFDDGSTVRCTPDHRFLLRNGQYKQAQALTGDDRLMAVAFDRTVAEPMTHHLRVVAVRWLDERADVYDITVDEHHNFVLANGCVVHNSVDGDLPAAARYTEAKLSPIAEVLLADVDQETVPLVETYLQDPRYKEPLYLTGHLPPVVNPISGIAVAMSTNVPSHNLGEVLAAATALLDRPKLTAKDLLKYIQGPDFPTGGRILGEEGILEYLETGKGRFAIRGTVRLEDSPRGQALVVTEIPYTTKDKIKESIAKAINERKVEGVADMRDESDEDHGMRVVLTLRRDADPPQVLSALYQHTDLQQNYTAQMVFLMGQPGQRAVEPRQVGMVELLTYWNEHQLDVLTKRLQCELRRAKDRLHIVQGLIVGAANAQQIVRIFQQAPDRAAAKLEIQKKYKLTEAQSEVIAQMTLSQVTKLDAGRYEEERKALAARIAELEATLGDPAKLVALLKSEYKAVRERHGDARKTVIDRAGAAEVTVVENIIEEKSLQVQLSPDGYLRVSGEGKRRPRKDYPTLAAFTASTLDYVVFVSSLGKVYAVRANKLPETSGRGDSLRKILDLAPQEEIVGGFATREFAQDRYLTQFTKLGRVKRSALFEYRSADSSGLADLSLQPYDAVRSVLVGDGVGHYLVVTSDAKALRFGGDQVRASGRVGQGVQAVSLSAGAEVLGAYAVAEDDRRCLALVSTQGYAKRTALADYPVKGRATGGVQATGIGARDSLAAVAVVGPKDDLLGWTAKDAVVRIPAKAVPVQPRDRRGAKLAELLKGEVLVGLAPVAG